MSNARDRLFEIACDDMPVTGAEVNEAINDFAHELAEKIRNEDAALGGETYQYGWSFQDAANLIDPES